MVIEIETYLEGNKNKFLLHQINQHSDGTLHQIVEGITKNRLLRPPKFQIEYLREIYLSERDSQGAKKLAFNTLYDLLQGKIQRSEIFNEVVLDIFQINGQVEGEDYSLNIRTGADRYIAGIEPHCRIGEVRVVENGKRKFGKDYLTALDELQQLQHINIKVIRPYTDTLLIYNADAGIFKKYETGFVNPMLNWGLEEIINEDKKVIEKIKARILGKITLSQV